MSYQKKLDELQAKIIFSLCSIEEFPDRMLPHFVYVEEEKGLPLEKGSSVFHLYNLTRIFPDGTCLLENLETKEEEERMLNEINIDWLITVWNWYLELSGRQEWEANEIRVGKLLKQMKVVAESLITSPFTTDFSMRDTEFIRRTKANTSFYWIVYDSGTYLYEMEDKNEVKKFSVMLDYFENHSYADFYLYQYKDNKLTPVFPTIARIFAESELSTKQEFTKITLKAK